MPVHSLQGFKPHLTQVLPLLSARWHTLKKIEKNHPVNELDYSMSHQEIVQALPEVARSVRGQLAKLNALNMVRKIVVSDGEDRWTVTPRGRLAAPPLQRYSIDKALTGLSFLSSSSRAR